MPPPVFAHQGGWDEILLVVAPLAIIGLLLWIANRRLTKQLELTTATASGDNNEPANGAIDPSGIEFQDGENK